MRNCVIVRITAWASRRSGGVNFVLVSVEKIGETRSEKGEATDEWDKDDVE